MALPDSDRPFSVVCDASDFAIGCALIQTDVDERERVIVFEYRQLKADEKQYLVHDKELLAMKYAPVTFRVHLLGSKPFVVDTDHASSRTRRPNCLTTRRGWPVGFQSLQNITSR